MKDFVEIVRLESIPPQNSLRGPLFLLQFDIVNPVMQTEITPFLIGIRAGKNGWDNKEPSGLYFGYPYNHQRSLKSDSIELDPFQIARIWILDPSQSLYQFEDPA